MDSSFGQAQPQQQINLDSLSAREKQELQQSFGKEMQKAKIQEGMVVFCLGPFSLPCLLAPVSGFLLHPRPLDPFLPLLSRIPYDHLYFALSSPLPLHLFIFTYDPPPFPISSKTNIPLTRASLSSIQRSTTSQISAGRNASRAKSRRAS